jgi:hypothetical protein
VTEQELRTLVRAAIATHAAAGLPNVNASLAPEHPFAVVRQHASHGLFAVPAGADTGGPCVIEPAVSCNHCGYCKSYGH